MNPLGLFLEPPGPLLTHIHTVYIRYSECLPTYLNPLAERTCFSQVRTYISAFGALEKLAPAAAQVRRDVVSAGPGRSSH